MAKQRRRHRPEEVGKRRDGYAALLARNRPLRRFLAANAVSGIGDWFNWLATLLVLTRIDVGYDALGWLVIMHTGMPVVLAPLAGHVADRFDRRRVMMACDLTRAVIVLGLLAAARSGSEPLIWSLVFLQYSIASLYTPAAEALLPRLTAGGDEIKTANALFTTVFTGAGALGSMLGGAAVAAWGIDVAFVVDAATFVLSAGLVRGIAADHGRAAPASDVEPGIVVPRPHLWAHLRSEPRATAAILAVLGVGIPAGLLWLAVVALGQRIEPMGEQGALSIGILNAVTWIGGMIGSATFNEWFAGADDIAQARGCLKLTVIRCVALVGIGITPFLGPMIGAPLTFAFAVVALGCFSLPGGALWVAGANFATSYTPDHMRGRVFAVLNAVWLAGQAIAVFAATQAMGHGISLSTICFSVAGLVVVMGLVWLVYIARWPMWASRFAARQSATTS